MHISEGVLSVPVLVSGAILSAGGVFYGLKKMDNENVPKAALLTAAFFVAALVHVPLGPSSVHLTLNGILGLVLGWMVFPSVFVALFLQALLFQFGGFTTIGVNTLIMASPGLIVYYLLRGYIKSKNFYVVFTSGLIAGFLSILLSTLLLSLSLAISAPEHLGIAKVIMLSHVPVMFTEGIISAFCITFIKKVKPEIFEICQDSVL
ncbi:MAG: cobalt transporter CbiM [Candidatus Magnetoovum sp. WYHC-5]|nr:cobalt transporter CbiM [Candidatus Magnetoovum sp. WYHC-5]